MKHPTLDEVLRRLQGLPPNEFRKELARIAAEELSDLHAWALSQTAGRAAPGTEPGAWIDEVLAATGGAASEKASRRAPGGQASSPHADEATKPSCFPTKRLDLDRIRYRGDLADIRELAETYRIGDYLEAFEENLLQQENDIRSKLLTDGVRLTASISPRIYGVFSGICERLGIDLTPEIFSLPDPRVNAFAVLSHGDGRQPRACIGLTSGALELLGDDELAFILGHELGHFLYENNRMNALISHDQSNPALTVLPPFGESIFLRWRKKAEISADRIGLIAAGTFEASARALMKSAFGLSEKNINLDADLLLAQIEDMAGSPELIAAEFGSHPLLPIRLKALNLFARSVKARDAGLDHPGPWLDDDALGDAVDSLMRLTRRHPTKPLDLAMMNAVALGGVSVLGADREIDDEESKILIQILHRVFTDFPDEVIPVSADVIGDGLGKALSYLREHGTGDNIAFVVSRWAEIALADGALLDVEGARILELSERMGMKPKVAYGIMIGAAQAVGFKADAKLNRAADAMRSVLRSALVG